jgi:iron complex outermembrane receptor protein
MFNRHRKLSLIGASVVAAIAAAQSGAQEAQLEEIVVTARQRAERLEDVPATVQAFTATEIQAAGIERPQDFIALTPGVSQVQTAEAGDLQVTIRGINTGRDAETNFALVIDGVLQTNPNALNQELNNVSQIEVLKGPQGALYGRNAVAGAMIITTRKPSDSFEFDLGGGYGQYNSYKLNAYMGGPIGESTRASVSAYTRKTDGQWENVVNKCDDCVDFFEETGLSARLITDLEGGGTIDAKAKFSKLDAGAINFNASFALQEAAAGGFGALFYEDANKHNFIYLNNIIPENEQENINLSVKVEYPVSVGTLTAVAAVNDQENYFLTDGTSAAFGLYSATASCTNSLAARTKDTPLPAPFFYPGLLPPYGPTTCDGYQYQQRDQMDTSLEVRLTSPGDQAFRWVARIRPICCTTTISTARCSRALVSSRTTSRMVSKSPWRCVTTKRSAKCRTTCRRSARKRRASVVRASSSTRPTMPTRRSPASRVVRRPSRSCSRSFRSTGRQRTAWRSSRAMASASARVVSTPRVAAPRSSKTSAVSARARRSGTRSLSAPS